MEDTLYGKPLIQRKEFIKLLRNEDPVNEIYIFSGDRNPKEQKIKVYMVPIDVPIYRLKNIRTKSPQMTYIAKNGLNSDFFKRDQEDRQALKAQHELLLGIANSEQFKGANQVTTFRTSGYDKAHPMIMTSDGVLVNGNTRMSALRFLYNEDRAGFSMFERVPIAILPDSFNEKDFRELELHLQINPDIKKDYSWISEAIDCKERLAEGVKIEDLVNAYGRNKKEPRNPTNLINQLHVADIYLKYINRMNDYESLETIQFAFWAWADWRSKNLRDIKRVEFIDVTCCELIKNRDNLDEEGIRGALYKFINSLSKKYLNDPALWGHTITQLSIDTKTKISDSIFNEKDMSEESRLLQTDEEVNLTNNQEGIESIADSHVGNNDLDNSHIGNENNLDQVEFFPELLTNSVFDQGTDTENSQKSETKFSFMDFYEEQNNSDSTQQNDSEETHDISKLLVEAGDNNVNIISTVMNVISTRDEEKKRTSDSNLVFNDAILINKSILDCINRIEQNDKTFNKLEEAKGELIKAKGQIDILISLIDKKHT